MSRFLHNLISTARNPARSVHPIVASIHSSPAQVDPEDIEDAATSIPLARAPLAVAPQSVIVTETPQSGQADVAGHAHAAEPFQAVQLTSPPRPPIVPVSDKPGEESVGLAPALAIDNDDVDNAIQTSGVATEPYSPLVSNASEPGVLAPTPMPAAPQAFNQQATLAMPAPSQRSRSPVLQPQRRPPPRATDEIQINIGRIEITAVPPPQAKPTPAPARKSPSLDEYLKRRPGRVR